MRKFLTRFGQWLVAVFLHWRGVAAVLGVLTAMSSVVPNRFRPDWIPAVFAGAVGFGAVVLAVFMAWKEERDRNEYLTERA